jgi:hypothetical protein
MSELKVLTEWLPITCNKAVIKENKEKFGKIILQGIIQRANTLIRMEEFILNQF